MTLKRIKPAMNKVRKSIQVLAEKIGYVKDTEILKKNQVETLETKKSINPIKK